MSNDTEQSYLFDEVEYELCGKFEDLSKDEQAIYKQRKLTHPEVLIHSQIKSAK